MKSESDTKDTQQDIDRLKRCAAVTELNPHVVTSLIERITISEPDIADGEKVFNIEIQYKFQRRSNKESIKKDTAFGNAVSSACNIVG